MDSTSKTHTHSWERIAVQPFWDDYKDELKSSVADIKNLGGAEAGHITAGKFLEYFVDYPWIHLDIAGAAFFKQDYLYNKTGGTGFGVRLLVDFLTNNNWYMVDQKKIVLGISCGDISGIGLEILIKSCLNNKLFDFCIPILYAPFMAVNFYKKL